MDPFPPWRHINMNNTNWWRSMNIDNRLEAENYLNQLSEGVLIDVFTKLETKQSIYVCSHVLRTMYMDIWKKVPILYFSSHSYQNLSDFDDFVNKVLTDKGSFPLETLVYHRYGKESKTNEILLTRVLQYAFDHGVENIWICLKAHNGRSTKVNFPTFILECRTLKLLHLDHCYLQNLNDIKGTKSSLLEGLHLLNLSQTLVALSDRRLRLPFSILTNPFGLTWNNLRSLNIHKVCLSCDENQTVAPFEELVNLNNLSISRVLFRSHRPDEFIISAPKLSNLRLSLNKFGCTVRIIGKKLRQVMILSTLTWITIDLNYISMEDGLIIRTDEPKTTVSEYSIVKVSWSPEEGRDVDMSCDRIEVADTNIDSLLNAESLPSNFAMNYKCMEGERLVITV